MEIGGIIVGAYIPQCPVKEHQEAVSGYMGEKTRDRLVALMLVDVMTYSQILA